MIAHTGEDKTMKLHGSIYRDDSAFGLCIIWEIRKVRPFDAYGEAEVVDGGKCNSWAKAAKDMGDRLTELSKKG